MKTLFLFISMGFVLASPISAGILLCYIPIIGYTKTPDGEGYYGFNHNRNAFIEIISYSKLLRDAKRSNQVFFEKLFNPKAEEIKLPN